MAKQNDLPGIPKPATTYFRINYQHVAPNAQLRAGALVIEAENIQKARDAAVLKLEATYGTTWHKITSIKSMTEEAPF